MFRASLTFLLMAFLFLFLGAAGTGQFAKEIIEGLLVVFVLLSILSFGAALIASKEEKEVKGRFPA